MKNSIKRIWTPAILAIAFASAAAAQQSNPPQPATVLAANQEQASVDPTHPQPAQRHPRYQVGRGDTLALTFPLTPDFNQKVLVQPDGFISLQGAGTIYVLGSTIPEVTDSVKKAYAQILHDPVLTVDAVDFTKPSFIVLGQVNKPGQYDLRYDITVTQAVALAGGFMPTAKTQLLLFHPVSSTWASVRKLNVKEILNGKNIAEDAHLQPGDMIFVPEKFIAGFRKYVPYSFGWSFNPSSALF